MNDRTQFEDEAEAEAALIAAFRVTVTGSRDALEDGGVGNVDGGGNNVDDGEGGDGAGDLLHRKVPSTVDAAHRKQVSALSSGGTFELDTNSPVVTGTTGTTAGALPHGSSEVTRGAQVVEDSYDVQVSPSLREVTSDEKSWLLAYLRIDSDFGFPRIACRLFDSSGTDRRQPTRGGGDAPDRRGGGRSR